MSELIKLLEQTAIDQIAHLTSDAQKDRPETGKLLLDWFEKGSNFVNSPAYHKGAAKEETKKHATATSGTGEAAPVQPVVPGSPGLGGDAKTVPNPGTTTQATNKAANDDTVAADQAHAPTAKEVKKHG